MSHSATSGSRRRPTAAELGTIPWLRCLQSQEYHQAVDAISLRYMSRGEHVARIGEPVTHWFGVVDGLLKVYVEGEEGQSITLTGIPPGGWFGEGTALKREPYRFNIQALRTSVVAGLPLQTFDRLLDQAPGFSRFVMTQLNERLAQFIAAQEAQRLGDPATRVARNLAAMFNPTLYPMTGTTLRVTQQDIGCLVGLSRQRVNQALSRLQSHGCIKSEYGSICILDLDALRANTFCDPCVKH